MIQNNKNVKIISIESRKGGVGKTTIGFVLSKILIDIYKYNVIFLDIDITGTSAGDAAESLNEASGYFKDAFSIASKKNKRLNLVEIFENYMTGPFNNLGFQWVDNAENNTNGTLLHKKKINVISSYLAEGYKDGNKNNEEQIFRPENIFDEFHSIWFIQMIKELIELWMKNNENLAVVIDNSPGHSGFEPAIEDWLTDQGPKIGKFLSVATPDKMDVDASIKSMMQLHNLYFTKWETAVLVSELLDNKNSADKNNKIKTVADMTKRDRLFFHKLAEDYDNEHKEFEYHLMASTKDTHIHEPHKYLAMIINKVPENPLDAYNFNVNKIVAAEKLENDIKFRNYFESLFTETEKYTVPFSWMFQSMYAKKYLDTYLDVVPGISLKSIELLRDISKSNKKFTIKQTELSSLIGEIGHETEQFKMFIASEIYRCSEFDNIMNRAFKQFDLAENIFHELLFKNENREAFYKLKDLIKISDLQQFFIDDVAFNEKETEQIVKDILQNLEQQFGQCLFTLKTQTNIKFFGFWCRIILYAVATHITVNQFNEDKDSILQEMTNILSEIVKLSMEMNQIFGDDVDEDSLSIYNVNWLEIADKYRPKESQGKNLPYEVVHTFCYNQAKTLDSYKLLEALIIQFIKINGSGATDKAKYINNIKELIKKRMNSSDSYKELAAFKAGPDVYDFQRYASDKNEKQYTFEEHYKPMITAISNILSIWGILKRETRIR